MKYKKLVIILSSVVGAILLCLILSFTLFRVSSVELSFKNGTIMFADKETQQAIIDSGEFSYSSPVFAVNKNKIIETLEKENYYLKVINVETVFPNKLVVHCAEREELYSIKIGDNLYYICDEDLKVLRMDVSYAEEQYNAVVLKDVEVVDKGVKVGDYLNILTDESLVKNIPTAFAYNNKTISDIRGMFKSITISYEKNYYTKNSEPVLTFRTYDDFDIKIYAPETMLIEKLNLMLAIVPKSYTKYKTHRLVIDINPQNTADQYLRYEALENS